MRLIHNYFIDFLKGFKFYLSRTFLDRITRYEFNYGNKSVLQYKLYKEMDTEYPNAYISLTNIRQETALFQQNKQGNIYCESRAPLLSSNDTLNQKIFMDFKWVTLQLNVKINCENSAEIIDFQNYFNDNIPGTNFMYYAYKYMNNIELSDIIPHWNDEHDISNIFYKVELTSDNIKRYCLYNNEPIINCVNISQNIDNENSTFSLDLDFEIQLQVPFQVSLVDNGELIKTIDITINTSQLNPNNVPILTDMKDAIFQTENIKNVYIIDKEDINIIDKNIFLLHEKYRNILLNNESNHFAFYLIDDYSSMNNNVNYEIFFKKHIKQIENNKLLINISDKNIPETSLDNLDNNNGYFSSFKLLIF